MQFPASGYICNMQHMCVTYILICMVWLGTKQVLVWEYQAVNTCVMTTVFPWVFFFFFQCIKNYNTRIMRIEIESDRNIGLSHKEHRPQILPATAANGFNPPSHQRTWLTSLIWTELFGRRGVPVSWEGGYSTHVKNLQHNHYAERPLVILAWKRFSR